MFGDAAAVAADQLAEEFVMAGDDAGHDLGVLFPQPG
jgi:hypothetical protein